jgi:hypothetical protein
MAEYLFGDLKSYESAGESLQARYICLSHCWGDASNLPMRTTRSTLDEYKQRIRWSILPKTFQHAVMFTRKLRIRYLWIDSLCIVQDDVDDWLRESGKMCSVFQHSTLTLCATASQDSNGGLFSKPMLGDNGYDV